MHLVAKAIGKPTTEFAGGEMGGGSSARRKFNVVMLIRQGPSTLVCAQLVVG